MDIKSHPQGSAWSSIQLRINIDTPSEDIEYACLTKSALTGLKSLITTTTTGLSQIVARCVRSCLKKLQNKFHSQFQSCEDFENKQALAVYIPVIAYNLAQVVGRIENLEVRTKLAELVTFGDNVEVRVKDELIRLLGPRKKRDGINEEVLF